MPLGLLLLRARGIVPRAAGCERKSGDAVPTRQRSHLGIVTEIADQHDFVQATAHVFHLARGILDLAAYSVIQPKGTSNRFHASRTDFARLPINMTLFRLRLTYSSWREGFSISPRTVSSNQRERPTDFTHLELISRRIARAFLP